MEKSGNLDVKTIANPRSCSPLLLISPLPNLPRFAINPPTEFVFKGFYYAKKNNEHFKVHVWLRRVKTDIDCNWTQTQNHLIRKRTLNHLATLAQMIHSETRTWHDKNIQLKTDIFTSKKLQLFTLKILLKRL